MIIRIETKEDLKKLDGLSYKNMAITVMDFTSSYEIRVYRNCKTLAVFNANRMTQEDLTAITQYVRQVLPIAIVYSDAFYKSLAVK